MQVARWAVVVMLWSLPVLAAPPASERDQAGHVTVCVRNGNIPCQILSLAQLVADRIFETAGIKVDWHYREVPASLRERPIIVELTTSQNRASQPVGYALPYEGVHIRVYYNQIEREPKPAIMLAHVLVHEITHILQGVDRHSDKGIMKAHWTRADINQMYYQDLSFTPMDLVLIQSGLAARAGPAIGSSSEDSTAQDLAHPSGSQ